MFTNLNRHEKYQTKLLAGIFWILYYTRAKWNMTFKESCEPWVNDKKKFWIEGQRPKANYNRTKLRTSRSNFIFFRSREKVLKILFCWVSTPRST